MGAAKIHERHRLIIFLLIADSGQLTARVS